MGAQAFAALNLWRNPFGEPMRSERAALAELELELPAPGEVLQIIGDSGHGKSTHLLTLAARLYDAEYEYVPNGANDFHAVVPRRHPLCLDEAQRVKPRRLRALLEIDRTLVFGTHADLSGLSARPMRTVRLDQPVTPSKLERIVDRRLAWARREAGPVPRPAPSTLEGLIAAHRGDIRAIEAALYER
jgi:energy-coupling factor transporter ATP-binding protein EcfA2